MERRTRFSFLGCDVSLRRVVATIAILGIGLSSSTLHAQSGTVWTWGDNTHGPLGDNTTVNRTSPVQVVGAGGSGFLTNIKASGGGYHHTKVLKSDGTVWAWGWNAYGELGDNTTTQRNAPVQVKGPGGVGFLTNIKALGGGVYHTIALKSDGTVWAWGRNAEGELGDNTTSNRLVPIQVQGPGGSGFLTNVKAIAGGGTHTIALKSDGTVWAWGDNREGRLGDNTTTNRSTPVQVLGVGGVGFLTDVKAIAGGNNFTLALKADGTVYGWGRNSNSELGDGTTTNRSTPVQVKGSGGSGFLTNIKAIAAGDLHGIALRSDSTVWTWGYNGYGELGDNTTTNRSTPVQVLGPGGSGILFDIKAIAAGGVHNIAIKSNGTVWTWGYNANGELGDTTTTQRNAPVQVVGPGGSGYLTGISSISWGGHHSIALKAEGTLTATGKNNSRQLGDNTGIDRNAPVNVANLANPIGITAGIAHSAALTTGGGAYAWGHNAYGQCATGNTLSVLTPTALNVSSMIAVSAGAWHTLFLSNGGIVQAAGYNAFGQLGNFSNTNRSSPDAALGLSGIIAVAGGGNHSLALKSNGTVYAWGNNTYGQLGLGDNSDRNIPVVIPTLTNIIAIAAGANHSFALKADGNLYVWGRNGAGQVGNGANSHINTPVSVQSGVIDMAGGIFHSLAVNDNGTLLAWGMNEFGQLGNGLSGLVNNANTPQTIGSGYIGVSAGGNHSLGLTDTGLANVWGYNAFGQLGDGTNMNQTTPTALGSIYSLLTGGWYHSLLLP